MRRNALPVLLVVLLCLAGGPANAGIGEPDGNNDYPYVGVMVVFDLDLPESPVGANVSTFCSGVLISNTHVLTAAHCVDWISTVGNPYVGVSFDNPAAPIIGTTIPVTAYYMHPGYPPGQWVAPGQSPGPGSGLQHDLGILELAYQAPVATATLPAEGYLDDLAANGGLAGHAIVNVGYGVRQVLTGPPGYFPPDGIRRVSTSRYLGIDRHFLYQRQNVSAGDEGGSASGDSGSPKFLPGDDTILSITSWGDVARRGFGASVRVDTSDALVFISGVLQ